MKIPEGMVVVSKEIFFAYIGPRDIRVRCVKDYTVWETPERALVGASTPGWKDGEKSSYMLKEEYAK